MTDESSSPMDDALHSSDDVDPADLAWAAQALAGLDHLRPDDAPLASADASPDTEPMPAWVWARVESAIAAEQRAAVAAPADAPRRTGRATRWAGGLVAASVAVVAVGVAVTAFRDPGTSGGAVVAGEMAVAPASANAAANPADAAADATRSVAPSAEAFAAAAAPQSDVLTQPTELSFAGMVPPALRLVGSKTEYTDAGLGSQVSAVMARLGLSPETTEPAVLEDAPETVSVPAEPLPPFMSTPERLRDCITALTKDAESTALMIDISTYEDQKAAVVVAPDYPAEASAAPDMREWDVWVVDPECEQPMKAMRIEVTR